MMERQVQKMIHQFDLSTSLDNENEEPEKVQLPGKHDKAFKNVLSKVDPL